jgi:hypothetical protein
MNSRLLVPRRNPASITRLARLIGKFRYYRSIGFGRFEAIPMAWRAARAN